MKLLVVTGLQSPEVGGPATYVEMLTQHLPQKGVRLSVIPFSLVRRLPPLIRHVVLFTLVLREGWGSDVIYAQDALSVGLPAALAAVLLRRPFWLRVPGDHAWEQGMQRFGVNVPLDVFVVRYRVFGLRVRLLVALERWVAKRALQVIVPSRYLATVVAMWGVAPERIEVIYSAPVIEPIATSKASLKEALNIKGKLVVSCGRLVPWKGFKGLIEAVALLPRSYNYQLMIAGEGPLKAALQKLIDERGLSEHIRLLGGLPKPELFALIRAADVFVLNTWYEGMSHQLLETIALETPIVTTNAGGNPELIDHNVSGLLVEYNDTEAIAEAISRLFADPIVSLQLTAAAKKRLADFSEARAVEILLKHLNTYGG